MLRCKHESPLQEEDPNQLSHIPGKVLGIIHRHTQLFSPTSAPYHSSRVGRNCPWVLPAPLSLLQWDGAVQIPMAGPRGSTGSRSGRMGATVKRQLLSWPRNTLIPEDPRAQARCSSRGRA